MVILVEGASLATYLRQTLGTMSRSYQELGERIEDGGGVEQLEGRLGQRIDDGEPTFVIYDNDVFDRPGDEVDLPNLINHADTYALPNDFEALFPTWMLTEALTHLFAGTDVPVPDEHQMDACLKHKDADTSNFECLRACVQANAADSGIDRAAAEILGKVALAKHLADVARRACYQPEDIRRFVPRLAQFAGLNDPDRSLIPDRAKAEPFTINRRLAEALHGCLAVMIRPDIWLIDLDSLTAERVSGGKATGPACWSPDGLRLAYPSKPRRPVNNDEAVTVYDLASETDEELLEIGHNLCWRGNGLLYANAWHAKGSRIRSLRPRPDAPRTTMGTPRGTVLACVDRARDRILISDHEGGHSGRVCQVLKINSLELEWDGGAAGMASSEYSAGAFSSDGRKISWPEESGGLHVARISGPRGFQRLTPPHGDVMTSTWSPDGGYVAFPWSRWQDDPIRIWTVDTATQEIAPLIEGPFGDDGVRSLGCHSWRE